ncbi:MAG: STAS domain-containing protein [Proteobacteria bacterium]|nr:STAS domain-containing protein [Pseudomonadota bacterium]
MPPLSAVLSAQKLREFLGVFTPKLATCLREGYGLDRFWKDAVAGLTVAIVALPLAMGIAIASGATPQQGLFTAIIAGFIISALGGSRYQIGGPTAAFIVVVYGVIERHGYDGMLLATLTAGGLLVVAGLFRLGNYIKYIPYPVTLGFTAGIGISIFVGQTADLLGLHTARLPAAFVPKVHALMMALPSFSISTAVLAAGCLITMYLLHRFRPRWPYMLMVVTAATLAAAFFLPGIATIGEKFGDIPRLPPAPQLPPFSLEKLRAVLPDAATIALLSGIESLLSAVVADGMTGRRHRSNIELVAQGLANIASSLFGGLPATGAIARTATNIRAGATSPVAGILHALFLLLFMLIAAPLVLHVPLCALAAVLVVVAWNMSEVNVVGSFLTYAGWGDRLVILSTLLCTVFYDLTLGIEVGVVLAAIKFMHNMANLVEVETNSTLFEKDRPDVLRAPRPLFDVPDLPRDVIVYRIHGPFFFGAASELTKVTSRIGSAPRLFVLDFQNVPLLDSTGAASLKGIIENMRRAGTKVILTAVPPQVARTLQRYEVGKGAPNFELASSIHEALIRHPPKAK